MVTEREFERAYAIDCQVYSGLEISIEDKNFVKAVIEDIRNGGAEGNTGMIMWAAFAAKDYYDN